MPADVQTFDMLEPGILRGMTQLQLLKEIERVRQMEFKVNAYLLDILEALENTI